MHNGHITLVVTVTILTVTRSKQTERVSIYLGSDGPEATKIFSFVQADDIYLSQPEKRSSVRR